MKAMQLSAYGADTEFTYTDVETPTPGAGEVLVRVHASSVNTVDTMIHAMGSDLPLSPALPAILGMDFAGVIDAVGDGVTDYAVGDEVYGCAGGLADLQGALADYMVADARLIAPKPKRLSMREAAALPLVGITAYEGLVRAGVPQGSNILVHGGTGGVGHVAVQLAKAMAPNAAVFATVGSAMQADIVRGYGATSIDYKTETVADYVAAHTEGTGFDVIFDTVGGANMATSFQAAALNGNVASTVALGDLDLSEAHFKGLSLHVVFMLIPMLHNVQREAHGQILRDLAAYVDAGDVSPLLDAHRFGLTDAGAAYARLKSGQAVGKVVIDHI